MKTWTLTVVGLFVLVVTYGAWYLGAFSQSYSDIQGKPISSIALTDLQENPQSFEQLKGQETVIYFFASWCAPCFKTLKQLEDLRTSSQFKPRLLALALDEDIDGVKGMINSSCFQGEVWLSSEGTQALQQKRFGNERRVVPYVVRLGRNTEILERTYGMKKPSDWQAVLIDGRELNATTASDSTL